MQTRFLFLLILLLAIGCADVQPEVTQCLTGHTYGFWGGLWHGWTAPFALVGSLFYDDIAVFAVNNNGDWYAFGFLLGVGNLCGLCSSQTKS